MEYYSIFLPLALILVVSKVLSKLCAKFGMPSVVGMLLAGILISLIEYIPGQNILNAVSVDGLGFMAKIGVVLIMFSAGLETDVRQIKSVGIPAVIITFAGVIVPMGLGFVVATLFNGGFASMTRDMALTNLFYGVVLTATSVSVSVATLKELNQLSTKLGSTIMAAAILDDIIGIIALSFVIGLKGGNGTIQSPWIVLLKTILFFVVAGVSGIFIHRFLKWLDTRYKHHRMIPIFSLAICFFFAYASEKWFGVADITGAFAAGLMLSYNPDVSYIDRKSDIMSYMFFTPIFFANIGITSSISGITGSRILFGVLFIIAGMIGKVAGCGGTALLMNYSKEDSLRVGIGMMPRAEVALVCAQKGVEHGMISAGIMPFIVLLIIITSFITPIVLKLSFKNNNKVPKAA